MKELCYVQSKDVIIQITGDWLREKAMLVILMIIDLQIDLVLVTLHHRLQMS